jgi:hypothetical protein
MSISYIQKIVQWQNNHPFLNLKANPGTVSVRFVIPGNDAFASDSGRRMDGVAEKRTGKIAPAINEKIINFRKARLITS